MKLLTTLLLLSSLLFAQKVDVDYKQSSIKFQVSNMWLNIVFGSFRNFTTDIDYDTTAHRIRSIFAAVEATSVFTDNASRDENLRGRDYLKIKYFPQMFFEMKEIFNNHVVGYMTILDKKRPISVAIKKLDATDKIFELELEGELNRNEFGVTESSHFLIGKMVKFTVTVKGSFHEKATQKRSAQTSPASTR